MQNEQPSSRSRGLQCIALTLVLGLLGGCAAPGAWLGSGSEAEPAGALSPREAALQRLHAAVQASQPGQTRPSEARRQLERLLADDGPDARVHHPYARALLAQIRERQRLAAQLERLERELATHDQALADSERRAAELQRKLDALTAIERRLAPRPLPPTPAATDAPAQ